jgi:hypothetical protein
VDLADFSESDSNVVRVDACDLTEVHRDWELPRVHRQDGHAERGEEPRVRREVFDAECGRHDDEPGKE